MTYTLTRDWTTPWGYTFGEGTTFRRGHRGLGLTRFDYLSKGRDGGTEDFDGFVNLDPDHVDDLRDHCGIWGDVDWRNAKDAEQAATDDYAEAKAAKAAAADAMRVATAACAAATNAYRIAADNVTAAHRAFYDNAEVETAAAWADADGDLTGAQNDWRDLPWNASKAELDAAKAAIVAAEIAREDASDAHTAAADALNTSNERSTR